MVTTAPQVQLMMGEHDFNTWMFLLVQAAVQLSNRAAVLSAVSDPEADSAL